MWRNLLIGPADVTAYARARQGEDAANGTIKRELATLSKMLHVAANNNKLLRAPVIEKLAESAPRAGFVDRAEFDTISKHMSVDLQAAALIAFTFGWRKEEVCSRQLRQLDLEVGTLRLDPGETKNGEGRTVRNLERAGVSRSVAMKMTGHKTESVYKRYAIVSDADLKAAAQKLAAQG